MKPVSELSHSEHKEIQNKLIVKVLNHYLDLDTTLDIDDNVLLLRAIGKYCDQNYDLPEELKERVVKHIEQNEDVISHIFNNDIHSLMTLFDEKKIYWRDDETYTKLVSIQEYYTALLGLWVVGEIDPTNGNAWELIGLSIEKVDKNRGAFKGCDQMVKTLMNPLSMNPLQDLWGAMVGAPTRTV